MNAKTSAWKDESLKNREIFNVAWVINAPWAHPVWSQYVLMLYDLTSISEKHGEPLLHLPDATHEFFLWAIDPDHPIEQKGPLQPEDIHRLTPPNYGYQFKAASHDAAEERLQAIVDGIIAAEINPDTDWRGVWNNALFPDGYPLVTGGFWD
jgi:hypothetical protein